MSHRKRKNTPRLTASLARQLLASNKRFGLRARHYLTLCAFGREGGAATRDRHRDAPKTARAFGGRLECAVVFVNKQMKKGVN